MKKMSDITKEISRLQEASPDIAQTAFLPIIEAVDAYFAPDKELEKNIGECAFQVAYNYEYRKTVYKNQEKMPTFSEDFPPGYDDVRDLFNGGGVWEEMEAMPEDVFVAAFVYGAAGGNVSKSDTPGAATPTNPYLDEWAARIKAARAAIVPGLKAINEFCEAAATGNGLAIYFEEHGGIVSAPTQRETAKRVYITGGYLEIIQTYALSVHIPSYIEEL